MYARLLTLVFACWLSAEAFAEREHSAAAQALRQYQQLTGVPVTGLDAETLDRLLNGHTIYRSVRMSSGGAANTTTLRIVGYRLIDAPREHLWLAALAYDGDYSPRLTEHLISNQPGGEADWYQHVNMPWPLRDRHWLIHTAKNVALARQTDNRIWEHRWQLADNYAERVAGLASASAIPGMTTEDYEKAVLLPLNNGAWMMAETAHQQTLIVLHATMDMGGIIPDSIVARYTRRQLVSMLQKVARDSATARRDYDGRYPIMRGDGTTILPLVEPPVAATNNH